jgi:YVTN family beta-propeller protein
MTSTARIVRTSLLTMAAVFTGAMGVANAQPFAYVVGARDRGIQVLTVINTATNARVASIPLGFNCLCVNPNGIVISSDGLRVYVSNLLENTVSVVDTSTNSVAKTLFVNSNPGSLAVSPDGTRLYVSSYLPAPLYYVVQVVDIATNATVANIPLVVPQSGSGMAISPDGTRLYVSNQALSGSNIKVINTVSNTVIATAQTGLTPRGVDITPDGSLVYAAAQNSNVVSVISTATNTVVATVGVGSLPQSVRVTPDGSRVYVSNTSTTSVINTATNTVVATIPTRLGRALAFTPDGARAFVAADGGLVIIDTATDSVAGSIPFVYATEGSPMTIAIPRRTAESGPPPTELAASSIVGNVVTLHWNAPLSAPAPTNYLLEGGVSAGQVLASLSTGGPNTTFTFTAPTGAFYIRLHALVGASRSAASNEIYIVVPGTPCEVPLSPTNFRVSRAGNTIFVVWDPPASGPSPTGYVLNVTGAFVASFSTTSRSLSGTVGLGTYGLSVAAANACGLGAATPVQSVIIG